MPKGYVRGVVGLGATAAMLLAATLIPVGAARPASAKGIGPVINTVSTAPGRTDGDGGAGGKGGSGGKGGAG
jgi:hypothetical protein